MRGLLDSILKHCPASLAGFAQRHLHRMPESYQEQFAPAEIARHIRLLAQVTPEQRVEVEVRSLGGQTLEVAVVGFDHTGVLAAITLALASDGLDVQDVQLATYLPPEEGAEATVEPTFFVDVIRVGCSRRGVPIAEVRQGLRERLNLAFARLAEGDLAAAQTAASSDSLWTPGPALKPHGPPPSAVAVKEGMVLDGFRLEQRLATGGMSEVYLATQINLQRKVAVKVVTCDATHGEELTARFARETQILAGFTSPHIVPVLAAGSVPLANGSTLRWLAMEYMAHGDLGGWMKRNGPPAVELGVRWFHQALEALQYAHQHGVLHRDLKPQNLLLTSDGDVKLCDFGLSRPAAPSDRDLTHHGCVMGTPCYLSPEQSLGEAVDERSDIYSLGASFFHLFSGQLPFGEINTTALLLRVSRDEAPSLSQVARTLPRPLTVMIGRMLGNRREDRYQNVHVLLEDFRSYLQRGLLIASSIGLAVPNATRPNRPVDGKKVASSPVDLEQQAP
jgi:hypothetical protein